MSQRFNAIGDRICKICDKTWPYSVQAQACFESGLPPKPPELLPGERLRLKNEVYATRFSRWPADQNTFVLAGPLFDADLRRTAHCTIGFHPEEKAHRYRIRVRWMGCFGNIREDRLHWVWAEDVESNTEVTPAPVAVPVVPVK